MSTVLVTSHIIEVRSALTTALRMAAEQVGAMGEENAQDLCPVDTGNLKLSITHRVIQEDINATKLTIEIGTPVYYAPYVELGHSQQPGRYVPKIGKRLKASWVEARPFLRPAVEYYQDDYRAVIEAAVGN